jgi:ABC-type phosphate transport system substrate-binding protein
VRSPSRTRGRRAAGLLVTLALLLGAVAAPAAAQAPAPNNRADLIRGSGSDTTYDVMRALDRLYNGAPGCRTEATPGATQPLDFSCFEPASTTQGNPDRDVALSYFPLGSSVGINQLCQTGLAGVAQVDYARSSRAPRAADCAGTRFVAFARDAIPWVAFPEVPNSRSAGVTNLTQAQLRGIFGDCTIRDWRQIQGSPVYDPTYQLPASYDEDAPGNQPILVYAAQRGSGTRGTFDGFLGGGRLSDACIPQAKLNQRVIFENDAAPIPAADRPFAIFYYSIGRYRFNDEENAGPSRAVLGAIDGVTPTDANIISGEYPYARFVYNVYRATTASAQASPAAQRYVGERHGFICKPDSEHTTDARGVNLGQRVTEIIAEIGFVPLPLGDIGGGVTGQSKCRVTPIPA